MRALSILIAEWIPVRCEDSLFTLFGCVDPGSIFATWSTAMRSASTVSITYEDLVNTSEEPCSAASEVSALAASPPARRTSDSKTYTGSCLVSAERISVSKSR